MYRIVGIWCILMWSDLTQTSIPDWTQQYSLLSLTTSQALFAAQSRLERCGSGPKCDKNWRLFSMERGSETSYKYEILWDVMPCSFTWGYAFHDCQHRNTLNCLWILAASFDDVNDDKQHTDSWDWRSYAILNFIHVYTCSIEPATSC